MTADFPLSMALRAPERLVSVLVLESHLFAPQDMPQAHLAHRRSARSSLRQNLGCCRSIVKCLLILRYFEF